MKKMQIVKLPIPASRKLLILYIAALQPNPLLSPALLTDLSDVTHGWAYFKSSLPPTWQTPEASWRRMYVTQPPVELRFKRTGLRGLFEKVGFKAGEVAEFLESFRGRGGLILLSFGVGDSFEIGF